MEGEVCNATQGEGGSGGGRLTPEQEEAEMAKAKSFLKEDKFDEASDVLSVLLERR